jgi:predicted nucleic acid-binding protein
MARIALLDANVLWPQYLRDALIRAAVFDLYQAAWTDQIIEEMCNSLVRKGRVPPAQIDRTVGFMRGACPQFMVTGYEDLIPAMTNDVKDRHVLAAAVCAGADTIVTINRKHFPPRSRAPYGIDLHSPDQFPLELWDTSEQRMAQMLVDMAAGLARPPLTVQELVGVLGKHAPRFARRALASGELEAAVEDAEAGIPPSPYRPL